MAKLVEKWGKILKVKYRHCSQSYSRQRIDQALWLWHSKEVTKRFISLIFEIFEKLLIWVLEIDYSGSKYKNAEKTQILLNEYKKYLEDGPSAITNGLIAKLKCNSKQLGADVNQPSNLHF